MYYHAIRKSKIEKYLDQAFVLATNKPATMDSVQQNDWTVLNFNIESRLDEYLNLMEKAFISWQTSPDKEELISEWVKIQSKALFSDKELIMNVLAEIAEYEILNQFVKNEFTLDTLNEINIKKTQTFRYLYHLLDSKDKIDFYEYIIRVVPKIKNISDFKHLPKNYDLIEFVLKISKVMNHEKLAS